MLARRLTMKLSLITPYKNLEESGKGDIIYALTRQLNDNKEYYNFCKKKKEEGFDVIIDNNVHEGDEMDFEKHIQLASEVATILVIPDVLRDKKKTLEYYHYFMDKYYINLKHNNIKLMGVPQGETMCEIQECFNEMNDDDRVDMIGNSFDLVPLRFCDDKYKNQSMNRLNIVTEWLKTIKKPIHLLGSNGLWELYFLSRFKQIQSTDGKLLSRLALAGVKIDKSNWVHIMKPKEKMDFDVPFLKTQSTLFQYNLNFFKGVLNND